MNAERDAGAEQASSRCVRARRRSRSRRSSRAMPLSTNAGVDDLARQAELVQVDPASATSAAPRHAEGGQRRRRRRTSARTARRASLFASSMMSGSMPILAPQRRHLPRSASQLHTGTRSSAAEAEPARSARARRRHDRRATRHTIDHHGQERADQQARHDARRSAQCRLHAVSKLTAHDHSGREL